MILAGVTVMPALGVGVMVTGEVGATDNVTPTLVVEFTPVRPLIEPIVILALTTLMATLAGTANVAALAPLTPNVTKVVPAETPLMVNV